MQKIKKIITLFLCVMSSMSLVAQKLSVESIKIIDSLHQDIGNKRKEILSLASEGKVHSKFWGQLNDSKADYISLDFSVFMGETEFTVIVSGADNRGQVTVTADGENNLPFVYYIMFSQFDGVGCPIELDMGQIRIMGNPQKYDKEHEARYRLAIRMNTLEEISDLEMYIEYLQNTVIPVLDQVIRGSKK